MTSNLPFQEWTEVPGSERLSGALLDQLTHHVPILEMNGESKLSVSQCGGYTPSQTMDTLYSHCYLKDGLGAPKAP